jgi:hypothetical protein
MLQSRIPEAEAEWRERSAPLLHRVSQTISTFFAPSVPPCFKGVGFQSPLLAISAILATRLLFVLVLVRHIILRELSGSHFALVGVGGVFHTADGFRFHVLAFFHQLFHAFGIVIASAG